MSEKLHTYSNPSDDLETLKAEYSARLKKILYQPLTVENIKSFTDTALEDVTNLVNDLLQEYENNPVLAGDKTLNEEQKEDAVCEKLGIPNIPDILERILEVKNHIDIAKEYVEKSIEHTDVIITPPDESEGPIMTGEGYEPFENAKLVPRVLTLMYVLQTDFDLDIKNKNDVQTLKGKVGESSMRRTPYIRVIIPSLERAVYICEEENNTSFVFDTRKLAEKNIQIDDLDIDGKQDKKSLIQFYPGIGVSMIQTVRWRDRMAKYLGEDIPKTSVDVEDDEGVPTVSQSEFTKGRIKWLPFEEWKKEVKDAWDRIPEDQKPENVNLWYRKERKNGHEKKWPSSSMVEDCYSEFTSLNNVVGKENMHSKEYLPYDQWVKEVKDVWDRILENEKPTNVNIWYREERKKGHEKTWPSSRRLERHYSEFTSLNNVVGKESMHNKEYLQYDQWVKEVKDSWDRMLENEKPTNVDKWYKAERKKGHQNQWPANSTKLKECYGDSGFLTLGILLRN